MTFLFLFKQFLEDSEHFKAQVKLAEGTVLILKAWFSVSDNN